MGPKLTATPRGVPDKPFPSQKRANKGLIEAKFSYSFGDPPARATGGLTGANRDKTLVQHQ